MSDGTDSFAGSGPRPRLTLHGYPDRPTLGVSVAVGEGGSGTGWPDEAEAFAARQAVSIHRTHLSVGSGQEVTAWLDELSDGEREPRVAVDMIIARVEAEPDVMTLLKAQALLCELGRDEQVAAVFADRITRDQRTPW